MEIIPNDSSLFRSAVDALKEFLPQAQLHISAAGIKIYGMDVSHVGYVDYFLAAADCAVLTVPKPTNIGIQMAVFARTLNAVGAGDKVTLSTKKDKFVISYENAKLGKKAVYEIATLHIDEESMEIPETTYAASVKAKTTDIVSVVKESVVFGDSLTLGLDENGFHVTVVGDAGTVKQTLENTDDRDMELTEDNVVVSYGAKYISQIMKGGAQLSSVTQLEFDGTQPLRASFRFGTASHFVAYLAPKITAE
jgi:proliferating cell nuclear antigen PCNA